MPLIQRYTTVAKGAMVLTGNTLNIMTNSNLSSGDWINGAYTSTNTSLVAASGFPVGTTFNPANSSSSAVLNMPVDSTVLYAQLWWTIGPNDIATKDNAITFITPKETQTITPTISDYAIDGSDTVYYRGAVVTSIIENSQSGTYTFGNVPGPTLVDNNNNYSATGWFLIVVYSNNSLRYRYFNVNTGAAHVAGGSPSSYTFTNIATPVTGTVKGYLLVSETYGDLDDGATVYVGSTSPGTKIGNTSGATWDGNPPYANINNMFPANILIADTNDTNIGLLDTRGTFGSYNKNPFSKSAPAFSRVNNDIAGFDISSKLTNNQTSLFTEVNYSGSGHGVITSQSIQVDLNAPDLRQSTCSVDKIIATIGDVLTYTIAVKNTGQTSANNIIFVNTVPAEAQFVNNSLYIDNVQSAGGNPSAPNGISIGNIDVNVVRTISFKVTVTTLPTTSVIKNDSGIGYKFLLALGLSDIPVFEENPTATTTINYAQIISTKSADKTHVEVGDIVTYSFRLSNTGSTAANNISLIDTVPAGTTFVSNSITINNIQRPGTPDNINVGSIAVGGVSTVTFQVRINSQ